jgi:hypothetical protein
MLWVWVWVSNIYLRLHAPFATKNILVEKNELMIGHCFFHKATEPWKSTFG